MPVKSTETKRKDSLLGQLNGVEYGTPVNQKRNVGDGPGQETLHDAVVPPRAIAEIIPGYDQLHRGFGHP